MIKKHLTRVGFEPTHTFVFQKSRARNFLQSGALDRSAILPYKVYCTVPFGLFAVVLPFWKVQIRNLFWHIVSNFWSFFFKVLNWSSNNQLCQCKKVPFTRCFNLIFVFLQGYVLNPSPLWCNKNFDRELWSLVVVPLGFQSKTAFGFALFLIHEILSNA